MRRTRFAVTRNWTDFMGDEEFSKTRPALTLFTTFVSPTEEEAVRQLEERAQHQIEESTHAIEHARKEQDAVRQWRNEALQNISYKST